MGQIGQFQGQRVCIPYTSWVNALLVLYVVETICWRCETVCLATETSDRVVEQVVRGMHRIEGSGGLHDLQVGGGGRSVCARRWGQLFWPFQLQHGGRWDLRNGIEALRGRMHAHLCSASSFHAVVLGAVGMHEVMLVLLISKVSGHSLVEGEWVTVMILAALLL